NLSLIQQVEQMQGIPIVEPSNFIHEFNNLATFLFFLELNFNNKKILEMTFGIGLQLLNTSPNFDMFSTREEHFDITVFSEVFLGHVVGHYFLIFLDMFGYTRA
ncbi:hypothetical protein ACJX0J_021737, partial [Zea mays]